MPLRIIPLGGLGEVGKNMTVLEYGDDRIAIDAGLAFPRDEHLGVDLVLPDVSYLEGRGLRAIVLSKLDEHGLGATTVLTEVEPGQEPLQLGPFRLEFVRVAHSIPDSMAVVVETE